MKSGIIPLPKSKWDHALFFNRGQPRVSEKTYCKVGAFQNIEVSRRNRDSSSRFQDHDRFHEDHDVACGQSN